MAFPSLGMAGERSWPDPAAIYRAAGERERAVSARPLAASHG